MCLIAIKKYEGTRKKNNHGTLLAHRQLTYSVVIVVMLSLACQVLVYKYLIKLFCRFFVVQMWLKLYGKGFKMIMLSDTDSN